jgi:hypothetical protein
MQQLVRAFIEDGTFCPDFEFMDHHGRPSPNRDCPVPTCLGAADTAQLLRCLDGHAGGPSAGRGGWILIRRAQELHRALEGFAAQLRICVSAR